MEHVEHHRKSPNLKARSLREKMLPSSRVLRSVTKRNFSSISSSSSADYVILGAGSAGCVLGSRLSEDGRDDVAILEAGPSDINTWDWWKIAMPSALTYNLGDDKYNWDFHTVPQKHLNNRVIHQPRGRVLGGSSSLNAMVYVVFQSFSLLHVSITSLKSQEYNSHRSLIPQVNHSKINARMQTRL